MTLKHLLIGMAITLATAFSAVAETQTNSVTVTRDSADNSQSMQMTISQNGKVSTITINGDTLGNGSLNIIANKVLSRLNDTVISSSDGTYADNGIVTRPKDSIGTSISMMAITITAISLGAILLIVIACLLFFYMHRRRKYMMIEKAIENNYQLPNWALNEGNRPAPTIPATEDGTQQPQQISAQAWNDYEMRKGAKLAIISFGIMLFFLFLGIKFLAAIALIPFLLGVAKIVFAYMNNKNKNWQRPRPNPTSTENDNNKTVVTPPEFKQGNENSNDDK
mgnify:CR=1 FL=1